MAAKHLAPGNRSVTSLPTLEQQSERKFARKWTDLYDEDTPVLEEANFRARRNLAADYAERLLPPGGRVLDLGCGSAPVLAELRRRGIRCTGLDRSAELLKHASRRLRALELDDEDLHQGDCAATPFESASFDVVVCLGVVSYVENYEDVFAEIRRLLKPGGHAILSFRNRFNPILWDPARALKYLITARTGRKADEPFRVARFMDHRQVNAVAAAAGFQCRDFAGIGYGPIRLTGRKLLSEGASIRLCRIFDRLLTMLGADTFAVWLADVSMWVYAVGAEMPPSRSAETERSISKPAA